MFGYVTAYEPELKVKEFHKYKGYYCGLCQQLKLSLIHIYYGFKKNEKVDVVIRPEDIDIVDVKDGKMTGEVLSVLFKGCLLYTSRCV